MFYHWINRILVVVIIVTSILAFIKWNEYCEEADPETPGGSFDSFTYIDRNQVIIGLGNVSSETKFSDCRIIIVAPGGNQGLIELLPDVVTYDLEYSWSELTSFIIWDNTSDGTIDSGDHFRLYREIPLDIGLWTISLFHIETQGVISKRSFIIPDPRLTPVGSFQPADRIDEQNYWIEFGIFNPPTAFYYYQLVLISPDATSNDSRRVWDLSECTGPCLQYNDSVSLNIVQESTDDIILPGSGLKISTTGDQLVDGLWSVALIYSFTGETACFQEFEVPKLET